MRIENMHKCNTTKIDQCEVNGSTVTSRTCSISNEEICISSKHIHCSRQQNVAISHVTWTWTAEDSLHQIETSSITRIGISKPEDIKRSTRKAYLKIHDYTRNSGNGPNYCGTHINKQDYLKNLQTKSIIHHYIILA
mgnify:CR=1 FL=1